MHNQDEIWNLLIKLEHANGNKQRTADIINELCPQSLLESDRCKKLLNHTVSVGSQERASLLLPAVMTLHGLWVDLEDFERRLLGKF